LNDLEHLKRLSSVKSSAGIKFLTPAVYPGNHCPMRFASGIVGNIQGLSSLLVGMQECSTHSRIFIPKAEGKHGELYWLYVLDANEVVFGCRNGVMDALRKMDKAGAKAIILVATCVPELIGEDFEGIIHEIQPELSARVTFVLLGQFKNLGHPAGSWKTFEALGSLMSAKKTDPGRVNILGYAPDENNSSLPSPLPELTQRGLALRYLAQGALVEDFQNAPDASINLVVSPNLQPLAVKMEREFNVPYIALHNLYDVESIDRAYRTLSDRFSFSWNGEFDAERQAALALQNQAQGRFKGLRYIFANRIDRPLPLAVYLSRLGMEPLLLHLEEYYPEDSTNSKAMIEMGYDPWICRMVNSEAELPILERLSPDLCFGQLTRNKTSLRCVKDMFGHNGMVGYGRTANLLKSIIGVLDGTGAPMRGGRGRHGAA